MSAVNITVQALLAGAGTPTIVRDRVNPIVAPGTDPLPCIVVNLISDIEITSVAERSRFAQSRVSVQALAKTATEAIALGEAIKNDLERVSGVYAGCSATFRQVGADATDYADDVSVKRRTIDFYVWWRPAA